MNNKDITENSLPIIDMLMPLGGNGGVEMVVNQTALYLNSHGYRVRVVQLCFFGDVWLDPSVEFYPLLSAPMENLLDSIALYERFIDSHGAPNLLLAVTFPALVVAGKKAFENLGLSSIPVVSWLHGPLDTYAQEGAGGLGSLSYGNANFVLSEKVLNQVESILPEKRNYLIPNPIDFSKCTTIDSYNMNTPTLLYVGRLSDEKCVDIIIKAVAMCDFTWNLDIVGTGPCEADLKSLAASLNLEDRVHFLGWKSSPWIEKKECAAFVLASDYEGFCMAAVEALYVGLPVITPPLDLMQTLITPGENGYIYPNRNIEALAQILDMYGKGQFPTIDPANCRNTVMQYEKETALNEFKLCIDDVLTSTLDQT